MSVKKIVRSLVWVDPVEKATATANFGLIHQDRFRNLTKPEDGVLAHLVDFYIQYAEAPSMQVVIDHFERMAAPEEVTLLEDARSEPVYSGSSLDKTIETEVEEQATQKLKQDLQRALKIATQGETTKGQTARGVDDAVSFIFTTIEGRPLRNDDHIPASMKEADKKLDALYYDRKTNPLKTYGVKTGYGLIDMSTAGIRKKQLYTHAGFVGHLKSTMIFNMMVNEAVSGWNPLLFTSEMPADDVKLLLVAIHSADPKFNGVARPLSSQRLLLGALNAAEEKFFKDVKDDLINNPDHGLIKVVDSSEFRDFGSIMQRTIREDSKDEVDICWIDYLTRLPVEVKYRAMKIDEARNETIADAKRFAMGFKKGVGLAVGTAFQINRDGYKRAKEEGGKYNKTALAQYNAIEKESDVISYIFFDEEERATSEPKVGLLKSRWGDVRPDPVPLYLEVDSRRIFDLAAGTVSNFQGGQAPTRGADDEVVI